MGRALVATTGSAPNHFRLRDQCCNLSPIRTTAMKPDRGWPAWRTQLNKHAHRWNRMATVAVSIREARDGDEAAIRRILEPIIRDGSTYALPPDMSERDGMHYWNEPTHEAFVAESEGEIVGTYFMRPNTAGGGAHVANCGYMTAPGDSFRKPT